VDELIKAVLAAPMARWHVLGKPGEVSSPSFTAMVTIFDPQLLLVVGIKDAGGWRYAAAQP
jgi:hypothetical protein